MQLKFEVVIYVLAAFLYQRAASFGNADRYENSLIPKRLRPLDYALFFEVNMADKKHLFLGTTVIRLECLQPTSDIILNMKDLSLDKNGVQVIKELPDFGYESLNVHKPQLDTDRQWLFVNLKTKLKVKDILQIKLEYRKVAEDTSQDADVAFVKYSYSRKIGEIPKWLAVSIPGAINARRLYPCIDEPAVKTEVRVNVIRDAFFRSISNTWILNDQISQSLAVISEPYFNTPPLSPFSIGFVVGDLKRKLKTDQSSGIEIRIWSDDAVIEQMDFAGDTALRVVKFYQKYFNSLHVAYKADVVALPFYGRMDKWRYGLITLEESLVANENPPTPVRQAETTFTLCEVFCQHFFGPQTTFETWSENWLNMGLTLFYRVPCLENILSSEETSIANIHLVESFIRILSINAETKSHPVMVKNSRIDLNNLFQDTLLAETAHFLVRMMSFFLGKDVLLEQVKNYIHEFRFKVTSLDELWKKFPLGEKNRELLSENVTVKDIMDSWTLTEGFAHIRMTRNPKERFVTVHQELAADSDEANPRIIPLNFVTKSGSTKKSATKSGAMKTFEMTNKPAVEYARKSDTMRKSNKEETVQHWLRSEPIKIPVETNDWIIFNSRLDVLCRVEYDPITLKLLRETLTNKKMYETIDVMSRTQLISDLFASAEMGKLSYTTLLEFVRYLKHEKSHLPIMVALHEFNRIRLALFGTEIFSPFQAYVREILNAIIGREKYNIGDISEDNYEQYQFKKLIFTSACTFQDQNCVDQSKAYFAKLLKDRDLSGKTDPIPVVLREPFYCQAIKEGGHKEWKFLYSFYNRKQWEYLNDIILNALACTTDGEEIENYLELSLESEKIAPKDSLTVFKNVASNGNNFKSLESFIDDNAEDILKKDTNNGYSMVHRYMEIVYENTWKQKDLNALEAFMRLSEPLKYIEKQLEKSKQIARKNISWLKNMKIEISDFFDE